MTMVTTYARYDMIEGTCRYDCVGYYVRKEYALTDSIKYLEQCKEFYERNGAKDIKYYPTDLENGGYDIALIDWSTGEVLESIRIIPEQIVVG